MKNHTKISNTYTVIIGCGRLGASLATELSNSNLDVLIIDRDKSAFRKLSPAYGGLTLIGDALDYKVLEEAQINKATTLIAVTNNDNSNIMVAQICKLNFDVPRVLLRLYDPEIKCIFSDMGIETISPVTLSIDEISKRINPVKRGAKI
ncbi:TrkA family potassium uptake protein [Fusibacter bizertensis]|uniref:TrkA family potassium uptake protein n=1 Tax=Fusibacter bizertensis TaxID=1488331 RepID=A0ABT6NEZ5_9FIRM|nr:TrkA family potassium uptake protein [Fusibacter bizertensis]MDH8678991.1 TrkA family potassium uptake protein [Fusibacter bizertensis]